MENENPLALFVARLKEESPENFAKLDARVGAKIKEEGKA